MESKLARAAEASRYLIVNDANVAARVRAIESGSAWLLRASYIPGFGQDVGVARRLRVGLLAPVGLGWVDSRAELS